VDRNSDDNLRKNIGMMPPGGKLPLLEFVKGYVVAKEGRCEIARHVLLKFAGESAEAVRHPYAIPIYVWCAARSGQEEQAEKRLEEYRQAAGDNFHTALSQAFLAGIRGKDEDAVELLEKARGRIYSVRSLFQAYSWYQLLEGTFWLSRESGKEGYRLLALRYARMVQVVYPEHAWAYAIEALLAESTEERQSAAAKALFLDRNSAYLTQVPLADLEGARTILERGNPFTKKADRDSDVSL
jgi:hypothetical protein